MELLCSACHATADVERAEAGRRRAASALYDARLDGWATKVSGENWWEGDTQLIADEFDEWAEKQPDDW